LHRARPAGRFVGDHWEAPDALWPANGQNQEGARELRAAAVKRPHTRGAYAWAHIGSPGEGDRRSQGAWVARVCIGQHPDLAGSQPRFRAHSGFWVTTLRTSSASVIASPLSPVHLAAVEADCRENVEAAKVLDQLLRHPRLTVGLLPQCYVGSRTCGRARRTLFWPSAPKESAPHCGSVQGRLLCRGVRTEWLGQQSDIAGPGRRRRPRSCSSGVRLALCADWYRISHWEDRCER